MPATDAVLLPLCAGLSLLGVIITVLAGRRGNRGRVVQGIGVALAPLALYLSGLLRLLWDGGVALVNWVGGVIPSPTVWAGLGLLGLCVILWVVGGVIARRFPSAKAKAKAELRASGAGPSGGRSQAAVPATASRSGSPNQSRSGQAGAGQGRSRQAGPPVDDDMAEIEALLKSRGIE